MAEDGLSPAGGVAVEQAGNRPEKKGNKIALRKELRFAGKMRKPGDPVVLSVKQEKVLRERKYI